jgi:hypothetical protein
MNFADHLKDTLIENKIYVATYWNDVKSRALKDTFEYKLVNYLIPLPIDQRYNLNDMKLIIRSTLKRCK